MIFIKKNTVVLTSHTILLWLSKFFLRLLIFRYKIEKHFECSIQEKLSNSLGKIYGVSIFWMLVSKKFLSGSQEWSNKISWVLPEILCFNDSKFKISELLVSLELAPALNSFLNENNVYKTELPYF